MRGNMICVMQPPQKSELSTMTAHHNILPFTAPSVRASQKPGCPNQRNTYRNKTKCVMLNGRFANKNDIMLFMAASTFHPTGETDSFLSWTQMLSHTVFCINTLIRQRVDFQILTYSELLKETTWPQRPPQPPPHRSQ